MMILLLFLMARAPVAASSEGHDAGFSALRVAAASAPAAIDSGGEGEGEGAGSSAVRDAFRAGKYPWYDAESGKLRPVLAQKPAWIKRLGDLIDSLGRRIASFLEPIGRFFGRLSPSRAPGLEASGDMLMTALLWIALLALFFALFRLWYRRAAWSMTGAGERDLAGHGKLLAELAGADLELNVDPWTEALGRRRAGDLAGALVYLFVHQLQSLDQIGMIRLVPGMTGRQYVLGLENAELRRAMALNLGLFEAVHYGHQRPTAAAFEAAWARALAFRRDVLGKRDET